MTLLQLALTQVAAGLYVAVVVRSLIYFLYFTLFLMVRQGEQAKTFAALEAEGQSTPDLYVSRPLRTWSNIYSDTGLIYRCSGNRHHNCYNDDNINKLFLTEVLPSF
jgi:hypothetical protein